MVMVRSLVTGGAGFLGSHVVDALLALGHKVTVIDDLSGGFVQNVAAEAEFVQISINDPESINELFKSHRFDYVFHLAAYAAEGLSHFIKHFNYMNNLIGSINLINASVNYEAKCVIYTSSIAVYGNSPLLPITEDQPPMPEDPYGIAKLAVEQELRVTHEMFGLDYIIFRPHNVYGERQNIGDRYRNVVGIFMNQILQDSPMMIFGDGSQTRAFTYISDVAPIVAESVNIPGARNEVFNIGADVPYSVKYLAEQVALSMGVEPKVMYLPARNEVKHAYSSHNKLESVFGKRPSISLAEGLNRMSTWTKLHGARQSKKFGNIEIRKNLPSVWQA